MSIDFRNRRVAGGVTAGVALLGGVAVLAATHPASAASALAIVQSTISCATTAACVNGNNTSSGPGVAGSSATGIGVTGTGSSGLRGYGTTGYGVKGASNSLFGVQGQSTSNYGVFGTSANGQAGVAGTTGSKYGVYGYTSSPGTGYGVYGLSDSGYGVWGTTKTGDGYGVVGIATAGGTGTYGASSAGAGIYGTSTTGDGVYGYSSSGNGLTAYTNSGNGVSTAAEGSATALYASANSGNAIVAENSGSVTIYGRNKNGNGADVLGTYIGIIGRAPASGGFPLVATDESGNDLFYVDGAGNLSYHGSLFHFTASRYGASVKSYSPNTTAPTVEDTGTAQLVGGAVAIPLDATFASSIDPRVMYRVFLTPNGDTRGLYVASKTANGFIVRETQGGHGTLSFDYRIVATALGQAGTRMAVASMSTAGAPRALVPVVPQHLIRKPRPLK